MNIFRKRFNNLFQDLLKCKGNKTCKNLTCRGYYFEPNSYTLNTWQKEGLYKNGIDRRAIFVCESPGPSQRLPKNSTVVERCWYSSPRDQHFLAARKKYGFENCYVTNVVKCGVRVGGRHTEEEITNCFKFLKREIEGIKPVFIVAVGRQSEHVLRNFHMGTLSAKECQLFRITHYSARRNPWLYWDKEFPELIKLINIM